MIANERVGTGISSVMTYPIDAAHPQPWKMRSADLDEDGISVGQVFAALRRRWLVLISTMVLITMAGFMVVKSLTPTYTATAIVVLSARQDSVVDLQEPYMHSAASDALVRSEADALRSRTLVDRVIDREDLLADPEFNVFIRPVKLSLASRLGLAAYLPQSLRPYVETKAPDPARLTPEQRKYNAASQLLKAYTVALDPKTYTVDINVTSTDPAKASRIANRFASEYMAMQIDERVAASERAADWLNPRLEELKLKVELADRAVEEFRQASNIIDLPNSGGQGTNTIALQQIQDLAQSLTGARTARAQLEAAQKEVQQLRRDPAGALSAPTVAAAPVVENLRVQEATAAAELASLMGTYGERHPLVVSARNAVQELQARLLEETNRAMAQIDLQLSQARANEEQLQARLSELTKVRSAETRALPRMRQLESEQTAARAVYDTFVQGYYRALSQDGVPTPKGRIIQYAQSVDWPSSPNIPVSTAVIFIASGLIAIIFVYALEAVDKSFHSAGELEGFLGLPVLGLTLKDVQSRLIRTRKAVSRQVVANPTSAMSETVRQVRTAITFARPDRKPKIVMVTSAVPSEGKTTLALMLARQSALAGNRAIVIEAELRKPTFARELDSLPQKGLAHYLRGDATLDEVLGIDSASGVHFIAAGEQSKISSELLGSPRMTTLLRELATRYDSVVLDTPPATVVADALQLGDFIDAAVLAVKWNSTPRHLVLDAAKKLRAANVPLVGTVMTQVDVRRYRFFGQGTLPYEYARAYYTTH